MAENWHIRSRARVCSSSERPFTEGETLVTALFPDPESGGYLRKDFCVEAWEARGEDEAAPFSVWRTSYVPPVHEEKVDPMKKEDPEELLRRLVEEDEEHTENVRYILAVMLERKKLLRETDSQRTPGGILRVYEHRKTGDVFLVRDPDIPLDEVEKVQEEVILLLEHGGRMPTPEELAAGGTSEEPDAGGESSDEDSEDDEDDEDGDEKPEG